MTTRDDISAAHGRIAPWLRRTPIMDVRLPGIEQPVTLKLEYLQLAGVFKARGAFNSLIGNVLDLSKIEANGFFVECGGYRSGDPDELIRK